MRESGASQCGEKKKETEAPFTPHINICLLPRLYPDTINPSFHLCLALNMSLHYPDWERSALSPVGHLWMSCVSWDTRQQWQQVFSFFSLKIFEGFFGHGAPIHCCQKVSRLFFCYRSPLLSSSHQTDMKRQPQWKIPSLRKTDGEEDIRRHADSEAAFGEVRKGGMWRNVPSAPTYSGM